MHALWGLAMQAGLQATRIEALWTRFGGCAT